MRSTQSGKSLSICPCRTTALNLSLWSSSTAIYRVKPRFHSRPSSRINLRSVKNEISENEARDDLGVWPWYTADQGQRWKVSHRDSLSLSCKAQLFDFAFYGPEVKTCAHFRTAVHWPRIPVLTPKPSFLPIFEPISCDCEQMFMVNDGSYMTDWFLTVIDWFTRSRFIESLFSEERILIKYITANMYLLFNQAVGTINS